MASASFASSYVKAPLIFGIAFALLPLGPLAAQQPVVEAPQPRLQGVVAIENSYEPVVGATVEVLDGDSRTTSGFLGSFALADAPVGTYWVRVTAPGHPSVREQVAIPGDGVAFVQFLLPDISAVLAGLIVEAPPNPSESQARTALDLLRIKLPSVTQWAPGDIGNTDVGIRLRGFNSLTQNTQPLLLVDGVILTDRQVYDILTQIAAQDVDNIEVLRGPAAAFRYPMAANGVIHVHTRK